MRPDPNRIDPESFERAMVVACRALTRFLLAFYVADAVLSSLAGRPDIAGRAGLEIVQICTALAVVKLGLAANDWWHVRAIARIEERRNHR
jgi:hypothetical protein